MCDACSNNTSVFPRMGFETPVRMCDECHSTITQAESVIIHTLDNSMAIITPPSLSHSLSLSRFISCPHFILYPSIPLPLFPPSLFLSLSLSSCKPCAQSINLKLTVSSMSLLHEQNLLVTGNNDKTVRVS